MSARNDTLSGSKGKASRGMRWALWSTLAVVAACGSAATESPSVSGYSTGSGGSGSGGSASTSTGAGVEGLPCDVAALLAAKCVSCHSNPPIASAPMALVSYADLVAPAKSDATKSNAEVSLARMKAAASPMPPLPGAAATSTEIAALEAWIAGGEMMGTCGDVDAGPNPFDAPAQCTSMTTSTVDEGDKMRPGVACIKCHNSNTADGLEAPNLTLGGTAYATPHEPNDCNAQVVMGPPIDTAVVEITDKNGVVIPLTVNSVGNFYRKSSKGAVAMPYTAKIKYDGKERVMLTAQSSGDCNDCHTQKGSDGAPGRILLP